MIRILIVAIIAIASSLSGCATSKASYIPPAEQRIQNSKYSSQPYDQVWDQLVRQLSSDFFVINNIDKNSRLINLSFTAQKPSEFVDCGRSSRSFTNLVGQHKYDYNTADSASYVSTNNMGHGFTVKRATRLEGRVNIYVAPEGAQTLVTVNAKYVVSVGLNITSMADGRPAGSENYILDFSTKRGFKDDNVTCYALGVIERKIMGFIP